MLRPWAIAVIVLLSAAAIARAGARRVVWLDPDASGRRPELGLFATGDAARACRDAVARTPAPPPAATAPRPPAGPPGLRRDVAEAPAPVRAACAGIVGLKHDTSLELLPPPGACGPGLQKVRVLDGTYRGRVGCVRADALRVPDAR